MKENERVEENEIPEGEVAQILRPYGVGIDTHSKFIAVCVLIRRREKMFRYEKDFSTAWGQLLAAAQWVRGHLPDVEPALLDYCIESTGCYHLPVLQAFQGRPSVVNPTLAGSTHRKTDVLDARMLAAQCMTESLKLLGEWSGLSAADAKGVGEQKVAKVLRRYGVLPSTMRIGNKLRRGYRWEDVAEAVRHYVPKEAFAAKMEDLKGVAAGQEDERKVAA